MVCAGAPQARRAPGRVAAGLRVAVGVAALAARAQATTPAPASPSDSIASARAHFDQALRDYRAGAYREAVQELEAARALDPKAKELVYNLAVVHEKLGELPEALRELKAYEQMKLTDAEREKAEAYEHRVEGALHEIAPPSPTGVAPVPAPVAEPTSSTTPNLEVPPETSPDEEGETKSVRHGRFDGVTIFTAGLTLAGVGVGTYFGVRALSDRPTGFVTGRDGTFADFESRNATAHREAIAADVAFGAGIAAAVATTILYFARTRQVAPAKDVNVTATWLPGGAAVGFGGRF
jgi:hypothetical protein